MRITNAPELGCHVDGCPTLGVSFRAVAFRVDNVASRARIEALELENQQLREELDALHGGERVEARGKLAVAFLVALTLVAFGASYYSAFVVRGSLGEQVGLVFALLGVLVLGAAALAATVSRLWIVGRPNEAIVLSGRRYRVGDEVRGYRTVVGGRVLRLPILESVERMILRPMRIEMRLAGVYAKGGRIDLRMRALARVARTEPLISHAIERFLGRDLAEVQQVVEQTLEGSLREVVATMAPEMMRGDLARTSEAVIEEATHDLENLGIELDQLQVLEVDESK
jgi:hypothetical protein